MEGNSRLNALGTWTGGFLVGFIVGGLIQSVHLATSHWHWSKASLLVSSEQTPTPSLPGHQAQLTHAGFRDSLSPKTAGCFSGQETPTSCRKLCLFTAALNTRNAYLPS